MRGAPPNRRTNLGGSPAPAVTGSTQTSRPFTAELAEVQAVAPTDLDLSGFAALVFGDAVSLGGFIPVTGLVICLMLARAGVRWLLYDRQQVI